MSNSDYKLQKLIDKQSKILIITAPSGTGKTTVINRILDELEYLEFSVSSTTRHKRKDEIDGKDYYFVSDDHFKSMLEANSFVEHALVHGNYYGTTIDELLRIIDKGRICILDVDVQGGINLMRIFPKSTSIFLLPPSMEELERRLRGRMTESECDLKIRIENATKEIQMKDHYTHVIINNSLEESTQEIKRIIDEMLK